MTLARRVRVAPTWSASRIIVNRQISFGEWAEEETVPEARDGLFDMARQYERLASELEKRIAAQETDARHD
jgi:hypothetical protein